MNAALAVKTWVELAEQYGQPRTVLHHANYSLPIPREQHEAYAFNIAGGRELRESTVKAADGTWDLIIRLVEYIEPGTLAVRYALDFWSVNKFFTVDHGTRAVIEAVYEASVRLEAERPSIPMPAERVGRGPAAYYDATDVS